MLVPAPFDLVGKPLSILRFLGQTLNVQFGRIRASKSGQGTVGELALHVQCSWRLDGPAGIVAGYQEMFEYAGKKEPPHWDFEKGSSLLEKRFNDLFGPRLPKQGWLVKPGKFKVEDVVWPSTGDLLLHLKGGFVLRLFPNRRDGEAWRLFAPDSGRSHLVFPEEGPHSAGTGQVMSPSWQER